MEKPRVKKCILSSNPDNDFFSSLDAADAAPLYAQSRQTGEGFRTVAPVDCRYRFVCGETRQREPGLTQTDQILVMPTAAPSIIAVPTTPSSQVQQVMLML